MPQQRTLPSGLRRTKRGGFDASAQDPLRKLAAAIDVIASGATPLQHGLSAAATVPVSDRAGDRLPGPATPVSRLPCHQFLGQHISIRILKSLVRGGWSHRPCAAPAPASCDRRRTCQLQHPPSSRAPVLGPRSLLMSSRHGRQLGQQAWMLGPCGVRGSVLGVPLVVILRSFTHIVRSLQENLLVTLVSVSARPTSFRSWT
jgi:hypothetical protein